MLRKDWIVYWMRLQIKFHNCSRPKDVRTQIEFAFLHAVLDYCPSVEKLYDWQKRRHPEYSRSYWYAKRCVPVLNEQELKRARFEMRFTDARDNTPL